MDPGPESDRSLNLTGSSLAHASSSYQVSCKSVFKFLRNRFNRETDKQTNKSKSENITSFGVGKNEPFDIAKRT